MKQGRSKISDDQIIDAHKKGMTLHEVAAVYSITPVSMWRRSRKIGIKFSNQKDYIRWNSIDLNEILEGKHPSYQTYKLKKRLIKEKIKSNSCEICGISEWNGAELNIQLDHIDGDPHNHCLDNLRMICPNCHSQTLTYCGKN